MRGCQSLSVTNLGNCSECRRDQGSQADLKQVDNGVTIPQHPGMSDQRSWGIRGAPCTCPCEIIRHKCQYTCQPSVSTGRGLLIAAVDDG
jgi:hypothetical protein